MTEHHGTPRPTLAILATAAEATELAASTLARWIAADRAEGRTVHVALAGGTTPAGAYRTLAALVHDWADVHLWLGDERLVPAADPDANIAMVRAALVGPAGIPDDQLHPVPTQLDVATAAATYGAQISAALPQLAPGLPMFDIVMLGLGEDAHVASLFPDTPGLTSKDVCIAVSDAPKPPPQRVSLTLRTINAARRRLLLATGAGKCEALATALAGSAPHVPASLVRPERTTIVTDRAAAALIGSHEDDDLAP